MRRHILSSLGSVLFVAAVIVVATGPGCSSGRGGSGKRTIDVAAFGRTLEEKVVEARAGLHARLVTLAELPRLTAAVATDEQTVRDLTADELAFRAHPGETIVLAQLPRWPATKDGGTGRRPVILLLSPPDAEVPPLTASAGPRVRLAGGTVVMSDAIKIVPRARADELDGVIAATWRLDLGDLPEKLRTAGVAAWLAVDGERLAIGNASASPDGEPVELVPPRAGGASLIVMGPAAIGTGLTGARGVVAALLAGLGLLALGIGRRRSSAAGATATGKGALTTGTAAATLPAATKPTAVAMAPAKRKVPPPPTLEPLPALAGVIPGVATKLHASPSAGEAAGRWIGRYEIVNLVGTGGMAEVYHARFMGGTLYTRPIALKVLQPPFARQPQVVEHFLDEARLGSRLDHPNIVQILDFGCARQDYFIAMELIDGADLQRLIAVSAQQGRFIPVSVVLAILGGICDGLHAAHSMRAGDGSAMDLVHRDVKSANVFVSRGGAVKVGDFGIALSNVGGRSSHADARIVRGTPGYMPPEQRLGQTIDRRADVYGVGAIAYELLAGFSVNLDVALLADKGIEGWPHLERLSSFRPDVTPQLEAVVQRALAYDAGHRFADCDELARVLAEAGVPRHRGAPVDIVAAWMEATLGPSTESPLIGAGVPGERRRAGDHATRTRAWREPVRL